MQNKLILTHLDIDPYYIKDFQIKRIFGIDHSGSSTCPWYIELMICMNNLLVNIYAKSQVS